MKDMEELHYFLSIEVIWSLDGIMIFQWHCILNLLCKFRMTECKPVSTPLDQNLKLVADSGTSEYESTSYRKLVGSLLYLNTTQYHLIYLTTHDPT